MKNARATAISAVASLGILAGGWVLGSVASPPTQRGAGRAPVGAGDAASDGGVASTAADASSFTDSTYSPVPTSTPSATPSKKKSPSAGPTPSESASRAPIPKAAPTSKSTAAQKAPANTTVATKAPVAQPQPVNNSRFVAGTYSGSSGHRFGDINVTATFSGDRITGVSATDTAGDSRSQSIDDYALPKLRSQVLSAQSANISGVSGATLTSQAYRSAMQQIMDQAQR